MFFLSGATSLLYEVVWFKKLHLVFGVSIFAIGAVVVAFMLGLAIGSRWAASNQWIRKDPLVAYAWMEIGIALFALLLNGIENGFDNVSRDYIIAKMILQAIILYAAITVISMIMFHGIIMSVIESTGGEFVCT